MTWRTDAQPLLSKPDVRSVTRYDTGISRVDPRPELCLRYVTPLSRAADDAELPSDPESRAAVMGYSEWGTGWPCTIPAAAATSSGTHPLLTGSGVGRRHTSREANRGHAPNRAAGASEVSQRYQGLND